jgi:hypothetical protein
VEGSGGSIISDFFDPLRPYPVLPEPPNIVTITEGSIVAEYGIADTDIIEVYFLCFDNFFFLIGIVGRSAVYDIAFFEEIYIAFDSATLDGEGLGHTME